MKVLHLPLEVAGQVAEICTQLHKKGIEAVGYNWRHNYLGVDHRLANSDAYEMANTWEDALRYFDIFHYHTGYTLYKDKKDMMMALEAGKKVIMHHRGNDVRIPSQAVEGNDYYNPYVYVGDSQPEEQMIRNLKFFSKYLSTAIVQDEELYAYVKDYYRHVHILPRLIDTAQIKPRYVSMEKDVPLIVHAPTSRAFKGTDTILKVIAKMKKEFPIHFQLVEKMSKPKALAVMAKADIVIDQILCGFYGNVSVEAMALGKPVLAYIRPDIQQRLADDCPVISANPDTLYDRLKSLLQCPEQRRQIGMKGREYVQNHHSAEQVINQLVQIYRSL